MRKLSWKELDCHSGEKEIEGGLESIGLQQLFRPVKIFSEIQLTLKLERIAKGTGSTINIEITSRVTRKLDEIREDLITQIFNT